MAIEIMIYEYFLFSKTHTPQKLPLFAIVNDAVFVLHGGLFHTQDATLHELNDIDR